MWNSSPSSRRSISDRVMRRTFQGLYMKFNDGADEDLGLLEDVL